MELLTGSSLLSPLSAKPGLDSIVAEGILEEYTPAVLVLSSESVERFCQKNGLSLVDLLRAHSYFRNINVPVRTAGEQPYRLPHFSIRIFSSEEMKPVQTEVAEVCLKKLVADFGERASSELRGDPNSIDTLLTYAQNESPSYWNQKFFHEFNRHLSFSDHEARDHPVACILAASADEENPISVLQNLFQEKNLPPSLRDGSADPFVHKHYILVHESTPTEKVESVLQEARTSFGGANVNAIQINSLLVPNESRVDIWTQHRWQSEQLGSTTAAPQSSKCVGQFLSDSDIEAIADTVKEITVQRIIPHMEQKVREHNHQVLANRRGLRNQIKNLWFRKGKEEEVTQAGYSYKSMEYQIRVLADYSMMLRDYELALSSYRLLASDYRSDKAWKHYAGVQEMIGLSLFMLDMARRETDQSLESAYAFYQKSGPENARYATRAVLWLTGVFKARGYFREAANALIRASLEETNLRAGILLEQAAFCFLRAEPMMKRKYGFHMVLAGNRYNLSSQRKHAIRAYRYAHVVYEGQGWKFINDHCNFTLGRLSAYLGSFTDAVQYFRKLLTASHQSPHMQATFLKEFLFVLQSSESAAMALDLDLPQVNTEQVFVHFEDQRTWQNPAARVLPESTWASMEEPMLPPVAAVVLPTWLDSPGKKAGELHKPVPANISVVGEDVYVDIEIQNPLSLSLELTAVKLVCEMVKSSIQSHDIHKTASSATLTQMPPPDSSLEHSQSVAVDLDQIPAPPTAAQFLPHEQSCSIPPHEKIVLSLRVTCLAEGHLRVLGVRWGLSLGGDRGTATAQGQKMFSIFKGRDKQGDARTRAKGHVKVPPHLRLNLHVTKALPRLQAQVHGLPLASTQGQVHQLALEITNPSDIAVKRLRMVSSHPGELVPGEHDELAADRSRDAGEFGPQHVFSFPHGKVLEGRGSLLWPLTLRARSAGPLQLSLSLYYEAVGQSEGSIKFRTLRLTFPLQVEPSLRISVSLTPSPASLSRKLACLQVVNESHTQQFTLRQLSCEGSPWVMAKPSVNLPSGDGHVPPQPALMDTVPPGQTVSLFFHMKQEADDPDALSWSKALSLSPSGTLPPSLAHLSCTSLQRLHSTLRTVTDPAWDRGAADIILLWEAPTEASPGEERIGSHHLFSFRSLNWSTPLRWALSGPQKLLHNFGAFRACHVSLRLLLRNCTQFPATVQVKTLNPGLASALETANSEETLGWQQGEAEEGPEKLPSGVRWGLTPSGPFVWSGVSSRVVRMRAMEHCEVPLQVSVFAAGVYDLSYFHLTWRVEAGEGEAPLVGKGVGHPFLVQVLPCSV